MISERNRRRIFFLCRRLGIDEETRRLVQFSATGKESLRIMNDVEAGVVITTLNDELRKQYRLGKRRGEWKNRLPRGGNVINLMTHEQRNKIIAMSMQIYGKFDDQTMDRFCKRQFGKTFKMMTADDAITLIEIQKKMLQRHNK